MRKTAVPLAAATLAALLLLSVLAGPALAAITMEGRVQTLEGELAPPTIVTIPDGLIVTDNSEPEANIIECAAPNALGALYLLAGEHSFPFVSLPAWGSVFINSIGGRGGPPDWETWWGYTVNGWFADVGVFDFLVQDEDVVVFAEIPGEAPFTGVQLVVEGPAQVGVAAVAEFRVLADQLAFANSPEDALRFGLDPVTQVQTPEGFTPVADATLHVGDLTYQTDEDGRVTVYAPGLGLHSVYAEKAFDDDFFYLPSSASRTVIVPFVDVSQGHPFHRAIHEVAARGVVGGYLLVGGAEFRPDNNLWRAQLAKMLCLALDLEVVPFASSPFIDLHDRDGNGYPHDFVGTAYAAGIIQGYAAPRSNEFGTYDDVTRAQVVTMIVRALNLLHPGILSAPEPEYQSEWGEFSTDHQTNAAWAEYNGLLDGLDLIGTADDPWAPMPRGETAQVIFNALKLLEAQR
jgi:hypothetical protein